MCRILLRPRFLHHSVANRDLSVSLLDGRTHLKHPIGVSPTAFQKFAHPDGEIAMAKGKQFPSLHTSASPMDHLPYHCSMRQLGHSDDAEFVVDNSIGGRGQGGGTRRQSMAEHLHLQRPIQGIRAGETSRTSWIQGNRRLLRHSGIEQTTRTLGHYSILETKTRMVSSDRTP